MKAKLTDEQVSTIAALAVNASVPVGLGWLHATNKAFTASEFPVASQKEIHLDYVQGRMVKLYMQRDGDKWHIGRKDERPTPDYQSWCVVYPTYEALVAAAVAATKEKNGAGSRSRSCRGPGRSPGR